MTVIKLWLDDVRPAPEGWVWALTVPEAKEYFLAGEVEDASLDHDLGLLPKDERTATTYFEPSGYELVKWLAEKDLWPKQISVHSSNPPGVMSMMGVIERYGPYTKKGYFELSEPTKVRGFIYA